MTVTFVPPRTIIHAQQTHNNDEQDVEDPGFYDDMEMSGLEDEHGTASLLTKKLVVPGQLVTDDPQFMR
jgi:hypothetical protein